MESNCGKLKQYLTSFLTALKNPDSEAIENETGESDPPRMEMIDFDELGAVLHETITRLDAAHIIERESAIVRQWLIDRIAALERGRQTIIGAVRSEVDGASLADAALPELVRRFEEASARLRSTAGIHNPGGIRNVSRAADSFKPFKS